MKFLTKISMAARHAALLLALSSAAPGAHAGGPLAIKGAATNPDAPAATSPRPLTRDELRACMRGETELTQREQALEHDRVQHKKMLAAYEQPATLDSGETIVDGGTAGDQRPKITVEKINESADQLNARTEKMHADNAAYQEQCASRRYLLKDKTALMKEQKTAGRGAGAAPSSPASPTPAAVQP